MQRFLIGAAIALGLLVPAAAFAQTSTTGLLSVYVMTMNSQGSTLVPSSFNVIVSGSNAQPNSFAGSINGTQVTLTPGTYTVAVTNPQGTSVSYSTGCNNTINAGQTQLCVITVSPQYNSYPTQPYPYPYGNTTPPLRCEASQTTAGLGQSVSFRATGGAGGTYNWSTAYQSYPNVGPALTISFQASGSQVVTVVNASQTAQCTVTINNTFYPTIGFSNPGYTTPGYTPGYTYPNTYPRLPSTGFAPNSAMGIAFASVLLIAMGIFTAPYVRRALVATVR